MALFTKKIFVILLMAQTTIILLYAITRNLPTNVIRWRSVTIDGLHTPQHNFTDNGNNLLSVRDTIPKSPVSSKNSVTEWSSRAYVSKERKYVVSIRSGGDEPTRSTKAEGLIMPKLTVDQHHASKRTNLENTKTKGTFQQIDDKQAWIYSAFFDHVAAQQGRPSVRIFGIIHKDLLHTVHCYFITRDGNLTTSGSATALPDSHFVTCPPFYIICDLPANTQPTHVSISFQKNKTATNRLQITYPGTLIRNFTVCYSILHSNYNSASQLIQSIEMNRILGAEHFVLYNYSVSPAVDQILQRYQEDGLLTVLPWSYPTKETWYYGQMTALNDCFYRNRNTSRFIVVVDTDQVIIPKNHSNWMELIAAVSPEEYDVSTFIHSTNSAKKAFVKTGCFIVRSSFFPTKSRTNWTQLSSQFTFSAEEMNNTIKHNIFTLSQFLRSSPIPPNQRTKYIARPDLTYTAGIHNVWTFVNVSSCLVVSSDTSLVHHYKKLGSANSLRHPFNVADTSMLRFKRPLYACVMERFKQFPNIFA